MGDLTISELRTEIKNAVHDQGLTNTRLDLAINGAYMEFGYAFKFAELEGLYTFTTVDGQESYAIGSGLDINLTDFRALHDFGLRRTAPEARVGKMIPETRAVYLQAVDLIDADARGEPRYYHRYGRTLYLRPVPDSTLVTLQGHYWKTLAKLSDMNATAVFTNEWDGVLLLGSIAWMYRLKGQHEQGFNMHRNYLGLARSRALEQDLEEFPEGGLGYTAGEAEDLESR